MNLKKKFCFLLFFSFLFFCSKEESSSNESDGFLNNNFNDKTIIVAGSTINDGAVIWINDKKIKLIGKLLSRLQDYFIMTKKYMLQAGNMEEVEVFGH